MSKPRNNLFISLVFFLKYLIFPLILIPLSKAETNSEIIYTLNSREAGTHRILGLNFNPMPKEVIINNESKGGGKIEYDLKAGNNKIRVIFNGIISSCENMFNQIWGIDEIIIEKFVNLKPTNMANMFQIAFDFGKNYLKKIEFKEIDTSAVTDMSHLFEFCRNLEEVDVSKFDTSSVINMGSMFRYCEKLKVIDTRFFVTSSVTDMSYLFEYCRVVEEIDLSSFNTAKVTTMNSMFRECNNLKVIDARSFDTSQVTDMLDIFGYCKQLVYINLSSFNTKNVKVMRGLFINCEKLKYLDISHFDYTAIKEGSSSCNDKSCRFHCTFFVMKSLLCLNMKSFYINDKLTNNYDENNNEADKTFNQINPDVEFCYDKFEATVISIKQSNCNAQCFKDMSKKFDVKDNTYVESCTSSQFELNDLCYEKCPYKYYSVYIDRKTCLKEKPGDHFILKDNIYYQCYESCHSCSEIGTKDNNYCLTCDENNNYFSIDYDKYAISTNCYKKCEKLYYFNSNHEYFCVDECPEGFKLIQEKHKCVDECTNDNKYQLKLDNTCVETCPDGTVNINNVCESCYESCGTCTQVGNKDNHKCVTCKSNFSKLNNGKDDNCYENCPHYYYFKDKEYICLDKEVCPNDYNKLISTKKKCIDKCENDIIFNYKNEYNGKCVETCTEGSYQLDGVTYCKCMTNTTCKDCSPSAIENNLCSSCNEEKNFYPIKEESDKALMNCYNEITKPQNYILVSKIYEACYSTCATCDHIGNSEDHQCKDCIQNYSKQNLGNNCYENCDFYFYFDNGVFTCTHEYKCPPNYNKLISTKKKCIDKCKNDKIFNYNKEYNGECVEECTKGSYELDGVTYCKCMTNTTCKDCSPLAIQNNLCSSCNEDGKYYPIKEESDKALMNCYNEITKPQNYILVSKIYEACYSTCATCDHIGNSEDHQCKDCIQNYSKQNLGNNCYENCDFYFYFDNGVFTCTHEYKCPPNYKLIPKAKKCIEYCKDDNVFSSIYEYEGVCVESCSANFYTVGEQKFCKCETNPACQDCPSKDNPNKLLCSTCNKEDGYYPKKEESSQTLKNCYNSGSIGKNYLLISEEYVACYDTCAECSSIGNEAKHECTKCINGYIDYENDHNCYEKCDNYYYFDVDDNNKFKCTDEKKCPSGYFLINSKNKCIKNCKDDDTFKYEYDGTCVSECTRGEYTKGDGQKVCKCMDNNACKDCPSENNENKLCSVCNDLDGQGKTYYPKDEEKSNTYKNCYNAETKPDNYIIDSANSVLKRCYKSCGKCESIGGDDDHQCTECKSGYEHKAGYPIDNCYPKCDHYFYVKDNNIICTNEEICPENYELIFSSTECVEDCNANNLFQYGNYCYEECQNGNYNKDGINTCKCLTNNKCTECNSNNECLICNNELGYYHIIEEKDASIKNCYNTPPEQYYLNEVTKQYEHCHSTCLTCEGPFKEADNDHQCKKCISTHLKINNDNNCYEDCGVNYYYFDENNNYHCYDKAECPSGYNWIDSTKKCILKCKDDKLYNSIYEYKNTCYPNCPNGQYINTHGTEVCKCRTNIACQDCNDDNSCLSCNNDKGYYHKKEESNLTVKNCYNSLNIPKNYLLISNEYVACYESCAECTTIGNENKHQCTKCKNGYTDLNNDGNCYEDCPYYYYFDEDDNNKYKCTEENQCPTNYKLIESTKKCIKNCKDADKYEYNNICQSACPQYYTDTNDDHICKLDCANFNMYFNLEKTDCISEIPKGYYLEDEQKKFIGKCHQNCEECEASSTETNNNCLKCKSEGTMYYDFGNCKATCENGNYIDENNVKKCKCTKNISCKACNENAECLSCNNDKGYYQLEEINDNDNGIIKCEKDPEGYYLSEPEKMYKKCYEKCKSCTSDGEDNCIECKAQYEFKKDFENDKKCYEKCTFNYYYDENRNHFCTEDDNCPNNMKLIPNKKMCIDLCKKDRQYKFEFQGKCFERCPENTKSSAADDYICEEIIEIKTSVITTIPENEGECNLKYNEFDLGNNTLTIEELTNFTKAYAEKYGNSGNYIAKLENEYYKIYIYNNLICLQNVSQEAKWAYFEENEIFLEKLKNLELLNDPIVSIITNKTSNESTYAFANPSTGELIEELSEALRNTEIQELEDIESALSFLDEKRRQYIIDLIKQGINLFDPSNEFYIDLCSKYTSPNNKDIPMRDRARYFFVNISGCESSRCTSEGIDYKLVKFKCSCQYEGFIEQNTQGGDKGNTKTNTPKNPIIFPEKKSSLNIEVFKCIKKVFDSSYFKSCAGGIIMLILSVGQIACMILYFVTGIKKIRKHTFALYDAFKKYKKGKINNDSNPPKKNISNKKSDDKDIKESGSSKADMKKDPILTNNINKKGSGGKSKNKKESDKSALKIKDMDDDEENKTNKGTLEKFEKLDEKEILGKSGKIEDENMYTEFINKLINPEFDEYKFDDVLEKDKRSFTQFLVEKIFQNQIFIKTFLINHIYKPLSLKIMLLILFIEFYFVITALFYTETYLSERFYSDKKETFLSFIPNRLDKIIFTAIICGIIQYFCSYFFDIDDHLRRILKNTKKNQVDLALAQFVKNIKNKFIILIVISMIITIFGFFYIACFNIVYPYIKHEWLKCSILMILLMQILNLLSTLLGACCRYFSIKWQNVKLFRLSLNLN